MTHLDPADLLFQSAPRLSEDVKARHLDLLHAAMAASAISPPARVGRSRSSRRRVIGVSAVGVVLLAAGAGAAAAWADRAEPTVTDLARCFATSDPTQASAWTNDSGDFFHDATYITGPPEAGVGTETAAHAIETCAGSWRIGTLNPTAPYLRDPDPWYVAFEGPKPAEYPVPNLVSCVLPTGFVGVFPDTTCAALRLPESDA